jgi:hypothetical protein
MNGTKQLVAFKVDAAIDAHTRWMARLCLAIEKGASEDSVAAVKADNQCEFGKWLYLEFPPSFKGGPEYFAIRELHATFHRNAASILEMALSQRKAEAIHAMEPGAALKSASLALINALGKLKSLA